MKNATIKIMVIAFLMTLLSAVILSNKIDVNADGVQGVIQTGVSIGGIDVSGLTEEEANASINAYIEEVKNSEVTFIVAQGNRVTTSYANLGFHWNNPEVVKEAVDIASHGNIIERYKTKKDIEVNGAALDLDVAFDYSSVEMFINSECKKYDESLANSSIRRENGEFIITEGQEGETVSLTDSLVFITNDLYSYYLQGIDEVELPIIMDKPEGSYEQLAMIKDLLGSYTTSFSSSGTNRAANVTNGCSKIDGTLLFPGEEFSAYKTISPFTSENGYYLAGSYSNGQVVESFGGGICQVTSTLYNAVLLAELEVTERNNHSMIVTYVPKSSDAAIAESSGKDFKFVNSTEYPIYIEGIIEGKKITFNIYGVETRPATHKVEYVSEVLSTTDPADVIVANSSAPIGSFSTSQKHVGYTARLWKVVYEDGNEVSREVINNSRYSPSPKTVSVGVNSDNADWHNRMMAALATGDLATCQATAAQIQAEQQQLYNMIVQQQQEAAGQ